MIAAADEAEYQYLLNMTFVDYKRIFDKWHEFIKNKKETYIPILYVKFVTTLREEDYEYYSESIRLFCSNLMHNCVDGQIRYDENDANNKKMLPENEGYYIPYNCVYHDLMEMIISDHMSIVEDAAINYVAKKFGDEAADELSDIFYAD